MNKVLVVIVTLIVFVRAEGNEGEKIQEIQGCYFLQDYPKKSQSIVSLLTENKIIHDGKYSKIYSYFDNALQRSMACKVINIKEEKNRKLVENEIRILDQLEKINDATNYYQIPVEEKYCFYQNDKAFIFTPQRKTSLKQVLTNSVDGWEFLLKSYVWKIWLIYAVVYYCSENTFHFLIHTSFKPAHLLFETPFEMYLTDFKQSEFINGSALLAKNYKKKAESIGDDLYKAPEVKNENIVSEEGDVYSIAIVIVQILFAHNKKSLEKVDMKFIKKLLKKGCSPALIKKYQKKRNIPYFFFCKYFHKDFKMLIHPDRLQRYLRKNISDIVFEKAHEMFLYLKRFQRVIKDKIKEKEKKKKNKTKKILALEEEAKRFDIKKVTDIFYDIHKDKLSYENPEYTFRILRPIAVLLQELPQHGEEYLGKGIYDFIDKLRMNKNFSFIRSTTKTKIKI